MSQTGFNKTIFIVVSIIVVIYFAEMIIEEYSCKNIWGNESTTNNIMQITLINNNNNNGNSDSNVFGSYFANELILHNELINYSYHNEMEIRNNNFKKELKLFSKIGNDVLNGDISSFHHLTRYYVHPYKYKEYSREYIINKWKNKERHINKNDLIGSHPGCKNYDLDSIKKYEVYFTHNCCWKNGPPHERTAIQIGGWDKVYHYTKANITQGFNHSVEHILKYWRGAGYWIWKPYIILNTLINIANTCDIVCYCDAGAWWNNTAKPLWYWTSQTKYGVMMFNHGLTGGAWIQDKEKSMNLSDNVWTKRDAFILLGVDIQEMKNTVIRKATYSCYQKNPDSIHFVTEWLYHSMDERAISDMEPSIGVEINEFVENRHDQSIMSLLSKKYGIPAFSEPSQYGRGDSLIYGSAFVNHWEKPWIIKHTRGKQ